MKTHNLVQGTPEWHAYRTEHDNASDAPAMLGCSPYKTRNQLLHEKHTGLTAEVDASTQRVFDDGHRFEALARPLAEKIIGEELYPVTGSEGEYSASFDGLTMGEDIAFEHKTLNAALRMAFDEIEELPLKDQPQAGDLLPLAYRVQMEQQLLVSGADQCLFMASKWDGNELVEEHHCWYLPDPELRQQIIDGWMQFAADLAVYIPTEIKEKPKAEAIASLPALFIHAKGEITTSNMQEYGVALAARLESVRAIVLVTDQDFSNAKEQAKVFREQREKLQAVKESMLSQTTTIGEAVRMIDDWSEDLRLTALKIEKDVEKEDAAKKLAMVNAAKVKYTDHTAALETEIAPARLTIAAPDFAVAIKGKRNYSSMQDAVDVALANGKIAADAQAKGVRANLTHYKADAAGYEFLFADVAQLVHKESDDFALAVKARIDLHKASEADKASAAAEKAKADFAALEASETARLAKLNNGDLIQEAAAAQTAPAAKVVKIPVRAPTPTTAPTLKLGDISQRLGFSLTGDFLKVLGFEPAAVAGASKLYHDADFTHICAALIKHVNSVQAKQAA